MSRNRKALSVQNTIGMSNVIKIEKARQESTVAVKDLPNRGPATLIDDTAKKKWRKLVKLLKEIDIIGELDSENLEGYCNAWAMYQRFVRMAKEDMDSKKADTGMRLWGKEFRDYGRKLGLDPDSRLKLAQVKLEKQEETIQNQFGAI